MNGFETSRHGPLMGKLKANVKELASNYSILCAPCRLSGIFRFRFRFKSSKIFIFSHSVVPAHRIGTASPEPPPAPQVSGGISRA